MVADVSGKPGETVSIPVYALNNSGFAGTGLHYYFNKALSYEKLSRAIFDPGFIGESDNASDLAVTTATYSAVYSNGSIYTLSFTIPSDAKVGTIYPISLKAELLSDIDGNDILDYSIINGSITVKGEELKKTTEETTTPVIKIVLGDLNNDGAINSIDAVLVLKDYAGTLVGKVSTISISSGDANGDGKINSVDAVIILKYYAGKLVNKITSDFATYAKSNK
jgi:hypothetical protein